MSMKSLACKVFHEIPFPQEIEISINESHEKTFFTATSSISSTIPPPCLTVGKTFCACPYPASAGQTKKFDLSDVIQKKI